MERRVGDRARITQARWRRAACSRWSGAALKPSIADAHERRTGVQHERDGAPAHRCARRTVGEPPIERQLPREADRGARREPSRRRHWPHLANRRRVQIADVGRILERDGVLDGATVSRSCTVTSPSSLTSTRSRPFSSVVPSTRTGDGTPRSTASPVAPCGRVVDGVARHLPDPADRARLDHAVRVGIVARRFGQGDALAPREQLKRHAGDAPRRGATTRALPCRRARTDGDVGERRRELELDDAATRARGAVAQHHRRLPFRLRRAARAPRRARAATSSASSRSRPRAVATSASRASSAVATSSMDVPQSVSCGCPSSSVRHAARSSARAPASPPSGVSASHGSPSRTSNRSRHAFRRFCDARLARVPCSVHV